MTDLDYSALKKEILRLTGVNLDYYKEAQMQRRLGAYLTRSGLPTWQAFFKSIQGDSAAIRRLKEYLTINVSSFLRDAEKWRILNDVIIPDRLKKHQTLKIWSAGCSRGHEPFSISILLHEMCPVVKNVHSILATDIDPGALDFAKAGGPYSKEDLQNISAPLLAKYFTLEGKNYRVNPKILQSITFRQHDLLKDPFPPGMDIIICRNVVIYFTGEVKDELYAKFSQSLLPGGYLFVGGTEIVSKANEIGLQPTSISFYRKNALIKQPAGGV